MAAFRGPDQLGQRGDICRVDNLDAGIASEIPGVEREDGIETVNLHGRDQPGVVGLLAGNTVGDDERFPYRIYGRCFRENEEQAFQPLQFGGGFLRSNAKTAPGVCRSGRHRPYLNEILRGHMQRPPLLRQISGWRFRPRHKADGAAAGG